MKTSTFKNNWVTAAAWLLALPTAYFILISILKFSMGVEGPFDAMQPTLEKWGISDAFGWNVNLLILFGPLVAFLLCILQVLKIEWQFSKEEFIFQFNIQKRWFPMLLILFSVTIMAILVFYFLVENYQHP